jgi:hypothetical protein
VVSRRLTAADLDSAHMLTLACAVLRETSEPAPSMELETSLRVLLDHDQPKPLSMPKWILELGSNDDVHLDLSRAFTGILRAHGVKAKGAT